MVSNFASLSTLYDSDYKWGTGLTFAAHDFAQFQQSFERRQGLGQGQSNSTPKQDTV